MKLLTLTPFLILFLACTVPYFASAVFEPSQLNTEKLKSLERWIDDMGDSGQVSGTFLFARKDKVLLTKTVGKVHPNKTTLISDNSSFNLGSLSKQFTAMGIMLLNHQSKLQFDEKVQSYLPLFPYKNITVRHLLNHTSGMVDYEELTDKYWHKRDFTNQDMMALFRLHKPKLEFTPGSQFEYSNTGYVVLAYIIEKLSNQSLADYSQQYIFQPLAMNNSRIFTVLAKNSNFQSRVYGQHQDEVFDLYHLEGVTGDGAVYSTASDLLKWHYGLVNNTLLPATLKQQGFSPAILNDGSLSYYGFGWNIDKDSPSIVAHSGSWLGFTNYIIRNIETEEVLIFLTNKTGGISFNELRNRVYSALEAKFSYIY